MIRTQATVRMLVCGNVDRCDDGAAIWAVSHLLPRLSELELDGLTVVRCGQLDIDQLVNTEGSAAVLIVDAAVGVAPGTIVTLDFAQLLANGRSVAPHSSHALPIDQVIGVARQLSSAPVDGLFVGIGGGDMGFGRTLSASVLAAMTEFEAAIRTALGRVTATHLSLRGAVM